MAKQSLSKLQEQMAELKEKRNQKMLEVAPADDVASARDHPEVLEIEEEISDLRSMIHRQYPETTAPVDTDEELRALRTQQIQELQAQHAGMVQSGASQGQIDAVARRLDRFNRHLRTLG